MTIFNNFDFQKLNVERVRVREPHSVRMPKNALIFTKQNSNMSVLEDLSSVPPSNGPPVSEKDAGNDSDSADGSDAAGASGAQHLQQQGDEATGGAEGGGTTKEVEEVEEATLDDDEEEEDERELLRFF